MKYQLLVFVILLVGIGKPNSIAQGVPDEIIVGSTLIEIGKSSGSGFFLQDTSDIFLVTARHVLLSKSSEAEPLGYRFIDRFAKVKWYPRESDKTEPNVLRIDLAKLWGDGRIIIGESKQEDFVVLKIGKRYIDDGIGFVEYHNSVERKSPSSMFTGYSAYVVSQNMNENTLGTSVYLIGFPKSLGLSNVHQFDFNRPLLRKGIIAGKDNNLKYLVIDCPSFQGNSGGPVFEELKPSLITQFPLKMSHYRLIGLVSAFIPLKESWINPSYGIEHIELVNSGYSVVVPIELVLEAVEKL